MSSQTIPIELPGQVGFLVTAAICMVVPTTLVILRIIGRRGRSTLSMSASDMCIATAVIFDIGLCIVDFFMVFRGGFGFHTSEIEKRFGPNTLVVFSKCMAAWPLLWNCCVMTSKWSVLLMYEALIPMPRMKLCVRVVGCFVTVFNLGGVLEAFLICRPYAANWDQAAGSCGNVRNFYIWLSALNLFSDLVILILPIPFVYKLQMPLRKRVGLVGMFTVGVLTCVVTLYRQTTLPVMDLTDVTSSGLLAFLASTIEIAVSISIACLPFLRAIWRASAGQGSGGSGSSFANRYGPHSGTSLSGKNVHQYSTRSGGGASGGGVGGVGGNNRGSNGLGFGHRSLKSDGFNPLPDDSSEIQLRSIHHHQVEPTQAPGQGATKITAEAGGGAAGHDDLEAGFAGVHHHGRGRGGSGGGLVVRVETVWNVETSPAELPPAQLR